MYRFKPVTGLLCFPIKAPSFSNVIRTLLNVDDLLEAYKTKHSWDMRSIDEAIAKNPDADLALLATQLIQVSGSQLRIKPSLSAYK